MELKCGHRLKRDAEYTYKLLNIGKEKLELTLCNYCEKKLRIDMLKQIQFETELEFHGKLD